MNRREKILAVATGVVVTLLLAYQFGLGPYLESREGAGLSLGGDVAEARETLVDYTRTLQNWEKIERDYQQIAMASHQGEQNLSAAEQFNRDLFTLLTSRLNVVNPNISAAGFEPIPNVDDYYFVVIAVSNLSGSPDQMINLLREMENLGLIIKGYTLDRANARGGEDLVTLNFEVARLVKHDEQSRRLLRFSRRP